MTTSTISNTITDPSGAAVNGVVVNARLKPNGVGYRVSDNTEVATLVSTTSNASGFWQLNLERNSNITPSGSYYEIEERIPDASGGARAWAISVGASNQTVYAALVTSPPSIAPPVAYLTQTTADARYQALGSFGGVTQVNTATYAGIATSASRSDHQHALSSAIIGSGLTITQSGIISVAGLAPSNVAANNLFLLVSTNTSTVGLAQGQLIYNSNSSALYLYSGGPQQICLTPQSATVATSETTTNTIYANLATSGPSVTLFTGSKALVTVGASEISNDTTNGRSWISIAVSGATTVVATDSVAFQYQEYVGTAHHGGSMTFALTGLTPGLHTFTVKYRVDSGIGTFRYRWITVEGTP